MTKKQKEIVHQVVIDLRKLQCCIDVEGAHGDADNILCKVLESFGLQELVEEYDKVEKRYA